jgi:hypothetical protein
LSVITSYHFLPLREKPKNSNSTKSDLVDTPKFAEFYYYPQLFFGSEKLTDRFQLEILRPKKRSLQRVMVVIMTGAGGDSKLQLSKLTEKTNK